ncbi:hypothetical protein QS257_01490 [Terrilactibacillus sp. S3-3]|nr:hypothetical protein QS257_01490 [Terrilactibacillus sp. S3-3]
MEQYHDKDTIHHVALMESKSDTIVIVLYNKRKTIVSSQPLDQGMRRIIAKPLGHLTHKGKIIEGRWEDEKIYRVGQSFPKRIPLYVQKHKASTATYFGNGPSLFDCRVIGVCCYFGCHDSIIPYFGASAH